ncbi:MAG: alpha/beta fold hydrolase [Pirellulaceae bacterium]|nr:alpha/beta fold hydrolase [Pirellulaceae bacterium]
MAEHIDWRALYPFESHHMRLGSLRLHYLDEGSGNPLLMVHGNPTWSFYWRNLAIEFRQHFRVLVPDHIGCGLSDKPQNYDYSLAQHISNLVELIETRDLKNITLLAHDWGGAIGLGAALQCADRFAQIVLFNTGAFPPPSIPRRIRACRIPGLGQIAVRGFNAFARAALTMATTNPAQFTPAVRSGFLYPYNSWANRIAIQRFVQDIPNSPQHSTWQTLANIEDSLKSLSDRPTKFIWGMQDWCFTPACLERLLIHFPHAEVCRIAEAGHFVVEDAHAQIVTELNQFFHQSGKLPPPSPQATTNG